MRFTRLMTAFCLVGLGCASSNSGGEDADPGADNPSYSPGRGEVATTVRYEPTAEGNYVKGEDAFNDEQFLAAQRYFGYIRSKFPYSRYAVLAELRIADCQFARKRYLEAIDSFQNFVRMHPTHEKAAYAKFRVGMAHYEQIPDGFFLLPPSHEKDQAAVKDAGRALATYLDQHPNDENAGEGSKILDRVRRRLMAHERYVADFYKNIDRDRAYVGRLETIRRKFSDVGVTDELLLEITEAWVRLQERDKAQNAAAELEAKFPNSELVSEAKQALASLAKAPAETGEPEPKKTGGTIDPQAPLPKVEPSKNPES